MSVRRRFLSPFWLIFSLPIYIGWRLLPALVDSAAGLALGVTALVGVCVLVPASVRSRSFEKQPFADAFAWFGLLTMGFFSTLFVMTVLRDLFLVAVWLLVMPAELALLSVSSARAVVLLSAVFCILGFIIARRPRIREIDIPVAELPAALHGFLIAQISDVHVGPTIKRGFVERIVARVNALQCDLIAVTGDLVDGSVQHLWSHTAPLSQLKARHGTYFVTGNHEYYSGERAWTDEIRRLGITVLKNEHVVLRHGDASLVLAGVTDYTAHHFDPAQRSDPARALHGAPSDAGAKVLLAHQPSTAAAAADAGFDVQLSGHTHGGQFWPWNHFIRFFQPFAGGLDTLRQLQVYVNRGTGYWGPPNRFGVPAEITRIRLVAE